MPALDLDPPARYAKKVRRLQAKLGCSKSGFALAVAF